MPSALEQAGSRATKQNKYAPIHTNRFFTGLWTNRNALRDAATPYLYEKFYSGSRFESLIDGSNMELSSRLTLFRRYGNSVYNAQLFPAINRFFSFEISNTATSTIKVIADTAGAVFDATGPNTKVNLFNKAFGAAQTSMESVGNTLYMGDGAEEKKWVQSLLAWLPNTGFSVGDFVVDGNNNLQIVSGIVKVLTKVAVAGNILTVTVNNNFPVGSKLTFSGLAAATFLNGITVVIVSQTATAITANFTHADYGPALDTGNAVCSGGSGTSGVGPGPPLFTVFAQTGVVTDNDLIWNCKGNSIQAFQVPAATAAPSVVNAALTSLYHLWAANTWYSPNGLIVDNQGTPAIQELTQGGTTGGAQPAWNAGGVGSVTNDNSAQWTNKGQAAWQANHVYAAGDFVAVTYTVTIVTQSGGDNSGDITPTFGGGNSGPRNFGGTTTQTVTYTDFFKCTQGGTSSNPGPPAWATGIGTTVPDNTVIWTNRGAKVLWTAVTDGPGAAKLVSTDQAISDSNGNIQNVIDVGTSAAVAPTWATAQGSPTVDGTITWSNGGPSGGKANTAAWTYSYAGINDVTGDIGTASPISAAITQAANSYIQVQGAAFTDTQVGKIRIYRTAQGGSLQLKLADIPNPLSGTWTYADVNPDGNLSQFIQAAQNGFNNPPPAGVINLAYHVGRLFGSVGNVTYYSAGAFATEGGPAKAVTSWPPTNTITWKSRVLRHVPTAIGLLVFTKSGINIITGDGVVTPFKPSAYLPGIGILSYNALAMHGSLIYIMDSRRRVIALDPSSGVSRIGLPIADKFKLFDPAACYLTYHTEDDTDEGLYVADGSTGWFRLNPTPAPETGMSWSPKATIVGGCKAVQTLEVAPGLQKMLVGPTGAGGNGPILARDLTTNQDNGANYADCYAVLGSIVLAQSGTMAQMEFIAMELPRHGSRATLQVRLNEIGGPFYQLKQHGRDPQYLPESTTLFADRFYFSATQKPAYCRHMQIKFSFPQENVQNELLTYTIFGAILKEK